MSYAVDLFTEIISGLLILAPTARYERLNSPNFVCVSAYPLPRQHLKDVAGYPTSFEALIPGRYPLTIAATPLTMASAPWSSQPRLA